MQLEVIQYFDVQGWNISYKKSIDMILEEEIKLIETYAEAWKIVVRI